jgi:TatD DNase family protein
MHIVDSHCHLDRLDLTEFDGSLDKALTHAQEHNVAHMLCVCIDLENFEKVNAIAQGNKNIDASVGVHPTEQDSEEPSVERLVDLANNEKIVAIGETGLDYFHCKGDVTWQQDRFRRHIQAAITCNKPLIIHTRNAREDTIAIMKEQNAKAIGGVMHCFTESLEMAEKAMAEGFYISFSGIVTFKNAKELQEVARSIPLERMLIETDSPYLAPMPFRGKTNLPSYTKYVAEKIALLRDISVEEVAKATSENYFNLFHQGKLPKELT